MRIAGTGHVRGYPAYLPAAAERDREKGPARTDRAGFTAAAEKNAAGGEDVLQSLFPGLQADIVGLNSEEAIRQYASQAGGGLHLAVAPDFVEWMLSSPEALAEGKQILSDVFKALMEEVSALGEMGRRPLAAGAVVGENGSFFIYTAGEEQKENAAPADPVSALKSLLESSKAAYEGVFGRVNLKRKASYSAARDLFFLSQVGTEMDVRTIISRTYGSMFMLKAGKKGYAKGVVEQTVKQMEAVIVRAKTKMKALKKEAALDRQCRRAEEERQLKRAKQLRLELERQRSLRAVRENAQIYEFYAPLSGRRMDGRLDSDEQPFLSPVSEAPAADAAVGVSAAAAPVAAAAGAAIPAGTPVAVQTVSISV